MNNQKTIQELRQLQRQARRMNEKLVSLLHSRLTRVHISIAQTRMDNYIEDVEIIISDLEQEHE